MYIAEVLSKFPVVQHFPFGTLYRWEHDPNAATPALPRPSTMVAGEGHSDLATELPPSNMPTAAPWASTNGAHGRTMPPPTKAPWVAERMSSRDAYNAPTSSRRPTPTVTKLAQGGASQDGTRSLSGSQPVTKAPWAKLQQQNNHVTP